MNVAARLVAALEALQAGDTDLCEAILQGAIDEAPPDLELAAPGSRRFACRCGLAFEWPGLLEHHQVVSGHVDEEMVA